MNNKERKSIYTHTHLNPAMVDKFKPLLESTFRQELESGDSLRKPLMENKLEFAAKQYANRVRVSNNMGINPLNEDAKIFGSAFPDSKQLFESVSTPGNVIGLGNVVNPDPSYAHQGGQWNPSYKAGSGDIPSYVFGLQTQIALHCIGFELIPTIAVDTPKVTIQYIDDVYGGGGFDDAENMPSFVDIQNKVLTSAWLDKSELVRAKSKVVFASNDGSKAVEAIFMVGSMIATAVTVQVIGTGKVAGGVFTKTNEFSVKEVIEAMGTNGKIHYTTAAGAQEEALTTETKVSFTSATRQPLTEASTNNLTNRGMTRAQHEKGPKFKLNVISMDKQIEMVGFEFEADTTNIQIRDFAAQGVNVIARLYNGVQNQLIQSYDNVILEHLYKLGTEHAYNAKLAQGIDYSLYIAAPSKPELRYTDIKVRDFEYKNMLDVDVRAEMGAIQNVMVSSAYENQMTHAERLVSRILLVSEFVAQQNREVTPDFMVVGGTIAATLKKHQGFSVRPTASTLANRPELHYSGTLLETISVYKNPKIHFNDPRILLGCRGNDTDGGAKFLAYDLASSRQTLAEQTMAEKIRVWGRFAIVDIGFYPELRYFNFLAINEFGWS